MNENPIRLWETTVFSVATRNFPWMQIPAPPPITIPLRIETFRSQAQIFITATRKVIKKYFFFLNKNNLRFSIGCNYIIQDKLIPEEVCTTSPMTCHINEVTLNTTWIKLKTKLFNKWYQHTSLTKPIQFTIIVSTDIDIVGKLAQILSLATIGTWNSNGQTTQ